MSLLGPPPAPPWQSCFLCVAAAAQSECPRCPSFFALMAAGLARGPAWSSARLLAATPPSEPPAPVRLSRRGFVTWGRIKRSRSVTPPDESGSVVSGIGDTALKPVSPGRVSKRSCAATDSQPNGGRLADRRAAYLLRTARACIDTVGYRKVLQAGVEVRAPHDQTPKKLCLLLFV